jgi:hypothetical protein
MSKLFESKANQLLLWLEDKPFFRFLIAEALWSRLQKANQLKGVQSMYIWLFIVPVVAKSLHKLEGLISITVLGHTFQLITSLPFSWRLFYVSALSFVVGSLIYYIYCPQFIRDHASPTHFIREGKHIDHLYDYAIGAGLDWQKIRNDAGVTDNPEDNKPLEESFKKMFWSTFNFANKQFKFARMSSGLFYFIGAISIGLVIIENTIVVLEYVFQ